MTVRTVLKMGHPLLRQVARPVTEFGTRELRELVRDMDDTMRSLDGAGLAAPQIGVSLRVVIFEVVGNPRYPDVGEVPYTVLVNPELTPLGEETEDGWEGCLSVPGLRGRVPRHRRLRYRGVDLDGGPIDRTVEGFHARVVQHEVDHLDGILYPMRLRSLDDLGYEDTLFPKGAALPPDWAPAPPGAGGQALGVLRAGALRGRSVGAGSTSALISASAANQSSHSLPGAKPRCWARK
jgi:peptide deformylase